MYLYDIDVDILVNGKPIKKYFHRDKIYIISKHSTEYSIRIKNNGYARRLVVVSVDGINVIDESAAGSSKAGYVVNGHSSTEVKGFRTSNESVHPFKFNSKEYSYAAKSDTTQGDTSNCGVIGVAVYREKEIPITGNIIVSNLYPRPAISDPYTIWGPATLGTPYCHYGGELRGCSNSSTNIVQEMSLSETTRGFDMGTEFSECEMTDKVENVEFEIGSLYTTIPIYYASYEGLLSMGVPILKKLQISTPNPFPKGFCKPPRR